VLAPAAPGDVGKQGNEADGRPRTDMTTRMAR
jgi:hypothetical protein